MVPEPVLGLGRLAAELIESDDVAAAWDERSALEGYSVGALAGHLARAVLTIEKYLDAPPPPQDRPRISAAQYFTTVLADHDPIDSDFHRSVRDRGADTVRGLARRERHPEPIRAL